VEADVSVACTAPAAARCMWRIVRQFDKNDLI
jgi:hypothetical protein